ncbi:NAD(P)-dependent alcohol dehydrogenase [Fibrisoma montanum]|uniref:NAD(P)-dependent alcohol dehydrogenase n=1 Tax=Fibrisoma montanum TaxID=2305895 RepID=A0A418MDZ6_9BACT|nr:NAD(P)-dependent alcohol dehydrogenase [Fibrisoma montanum]RIV25040.1 NAD(P)-dependent alcohol dehydrogenase [Fibrisoma montanum]
MRAAVFNAYGPSSVLHIADVPIPQPMPHQVLIRVHAAGINPSDWGIRKGQLRWVLPITFPKTLGSECAGVVEAVGELVMHVKPGDRVVALLGHKGGGYAEYALAIMERVVKLPDTVSFVQAAAVPVTGITALQSLRDLGHVRPRDEVLINGASGGVGTMGVQIARLLGANVTGVSSGANEALVRELGANRFVDYRQTDFTERTGDRYRVIFDAVNKRTFADCRRVLTPDGTYVTTRPSPAVLLRSFFNGPDRQKAKFIGAKDRGRDVEWLIKQMSSGRLRAVIDRTYPLEAVAEAHDYSEGGHVKGKLVIEIF